MPCSCAFLQTLPQPPATTPLIDGHCDIIYSFMFSLSISRTPNYLRTSTCTSKPACAVHTFPQNTAISPHHTFTTLSPTASQSPSTPTLRHFYNIKRATASPVHSTPTPVYIPHSYPITNFSVSDSFALNITFTDASPPGPLQTPSASSLNSRPPLFNNISPHPLGPILLAIIISDTDMLLTRRHGVALACCQAVVLTYCHTGAGHANMLTRCCVEV